jgi:carbon-monoxide dehydrogenase large subunit
MTSLHTDAPLRKEDAHLLRGRGHFVDNVHLDRMVHGAFVRSPFAHADIVSIDTSRAIAAGAIAVFTASDLPFNNRPWVVRYWHRSIRNGLIKFLASDRVRYVGEPIALVIAPNRYLAEDFGQLVDIEYRPLPAVTTIDGALSDHAMPLHAEWTSNVAAAFEHTRGNAPNALADSRYRVRRCFNFVRQAPVPLETRGVVADFDAEHQTLTAWISTQPHYNVRQNLATLLDISEVDVRVIAEDVGGGFGSKSRPYPEEMIISHASRALRRPVKWIEDRFENLQATTHSRGIIVDLELGCAVDGRFTALKADLRVDIGAYIHTSGIVTAEVAAAHIVNAYRFPNIQISVTCIGTNKTPIGTYRGAGQPEATFPTECLIDVLAKEIGVAAGDLRARNLVVPADLPYPIGTSMIGQPLVFESCDYPAALATALSSSGYTERVETDSAGRRIAYGIACGIETGGIVNFESALVRVNADGTVSVSSGMSSQGQGQFTTYAQICSEALDVPYDRVSVRLGDTQLIVFGRGAFAARGAVIGANAVHGAAQQLRIKLLRLAATLLQCDPDDLAIADGNIVFKDGGSANLDVGAVAQAYMPGGTLFAGEAALQTSYVYDAKNPLTSGYSVHVARVRLDPRTGFFDILDYLVTHDTGRAINSMIVDGQIVGAVADGIAGATLSEMLYDADGQPLTSSLADYLVATAPEIPRIKIVHANSPSRTNPLGLRPVGESGIIPVAAALTNALARAIDPVRTGHERELFTLPLRPDRVYAACQAALRLSGA